MGDEITKKDTSSLQLPILFPSEYELDVNGGVRLPFKSPLSSSDIEAQFQFKMGQSHSFLDAPATHLRWALDYEVGFSEDYSVVRPQFQIDLSHYLDANDWWYFGYGLTGGPSVYLNDRDHVGFQGTAVFQGGTKPISLYANVGVDSGLPQAPLFVVGGLSFSIPGIADVVKTANTDYHEYRDDPVEIDVLNSLDGDEAKLATIIPPLVLPDNDDFIDLLRLAKFLGTTIEMDTHLLGVVKISQLGNDSDVSWWIRFKKWRAMYKDTPYAARVDVAHPSQMEYDSLSSNSPLQKYLASPGGKPKKITIYPLTTYIDVQSGHYRVTVVNALTNKILYQKEYTGDMISPQDLMKSISGSVDVLQMKRDLTDLPAATQEDKQRWGKIIQAFKLKVLRRNADKSRAIQNEWEAIHPRFRSRSFHIRSSLSKTDFTFSWLQEKGFQPIALPPGSVRIGYQANPIDILWTPYEPYFAKDYKDPPWRTVRLWLPVGGVDLKETFYQPALYPLNSRGPYRVYSDLVALDYERYRDKVAGLQKGISRIEQAFGAIAGRFVERIYIYHGNAKDLFVNADQPKQINVSGGALREFDQKPLEYSSQHETWHAYDSQYGFSSEAVFSRWYKTLKSQGHADFFNFINESYFFRMSGGGHAQEHSREFLASLGNTLYAPQLKERLEDTTRLNRNLYYQSLVHLRRTILAKVPHAKQGKLPIIKKIDDILNARR